MIKEVIILAGGLGTRLAEALPGIPKCMAPVGNKPFLDIVIDYFMQQDVRHFIFALGFRSEIIVQHLKENHKTLSYQLSVEQQPLGTGGAVKQACDLIDGNHVLVTNGDTLFKTDLADLCEFHILQDAHCTLALKPMKDFDRYGKVDIDSDGRIISFREKTHYEEGLINGGLYALNIKEFKSDMHQSAFSFEKDYLEKYFEKRKMTGRVQDSYFIDIGIPEDYERACRELA